MRLLLSSALILAVAAPALAQQAYPVRGGRVVRGGGGGHVVTPVPQGGGYPQGGDHRHNGGGVVVVTPTPERHHEGGGGRVIFTPPPRGGRVIIRENARWRSPVVVQDRVVVRGPRVYYQPRVIERRWAYRPNIVVVRPYAYYAITPIYMPLNNSQFSTTLEQGEFWPSNTDYMSYYSHYSMSFERNTVGDQWNGYRTETVMTLRPQIICQDRDYGCNSIMTPPASRLIVTADRRDECGVHYITAQSYDGESPISYIEMKDYSRFNCDYSGQRNELDIDRMIHADGYEEYNLSGNVSYHNWF